MMGPNPQNQVYAAGDPNVEGGALYEQHMAQVEHDNIRQLQLNSEFMQRKIEELTNENARLKARSRNQRTELRRLNRTLRSMWEGVRFSHKTRAEMMYAQMVKLISRREMKIPTFVFDNLRDLAAVDAAKKEDAK